MEWAFLGTPSGEKSFGIRERMGPPGTAKAMAEHKAKKASRSVKPE